MPSDTTFNLDFYAVAQKAEGQITELDYVFLKRVRTQSHCEDSRRNLNRRSGFFPLIF